MKKILIVLAVLLGVQVADAQVKTPEAAKKAVESAEEASQNPKKAAKVATWMKLAEAYVDAYSAPAGAAWIGATKQELQLIMGNDKPVETVEAVINGEPCVKEVYATKEYYYNQNGQVIMINVTAPVYEDALAGAFNAYEEAFKIDLKQSKTKDIVAGLQNISRKYLDEGMNKYMLGDMNAACELFGKALETSSAAPLSQPDTTAMYNAGYTAWATQQYEKAKNYFETCLANEYYYEGGEVYAKLGDVYTKLGDAKKGVETLEKGFMKFPQSQSLLIGLINYYIESGENTDRLFELIGEAKKNEPENASLYYVEGNIHKQLGNLDAAVAAYQQCAEVDPKYDFAYYGQGVLYYDQAVELSEKAQNELDDAKYEALVNEFEQCLRNAIAPFEKAYEVSANEALKRNTAEYLKNIYYRFSSESDENMAAYKKYDAIVKGL